MSVPLPDKKKKGRGKGRSAETADKDNANKGLKKKPHNFELVTDKYFGEQKWLGASIDVEAKEDERARLPPGIFIEAPGGKYKVSKLLGAGGFGDVYEVLREGDNYQMAMKTEFNKIDEYMQRLRRELMVYDSISAIRQEDPSKTEHLLHMVDKGHNELFKFIIMPYTGKSLDYIKEKIVKKDFQLHTVLQIGLQTFTALRNLHNIGIIHRDIKPDNFVVGRFLLRNIIYLMDFGMSCKFVTDATKMPKESQYKFIGTLKYAPRATHKGRVQTRRDDMESWLYMMIELFGWNYLPWQNIEDQDQVGFLKQCFVQHKMDVVYKAIPSEFSRLMDMLDALQPTERPNYEMMEEVLRGLCTRYKIDIYAPFEWLGQEK